MRAGILPTQPPMPPFPDRLPQFRVFFMAPKVWVDRFYCSLVWSTTWSYCYLADKFARPCSGSMVKAASCNNRRLLIQSMLANRGLAWGHFEQKDMQLMDNVDSSWQIGSEVASIWLLLVTSSSCQFCVLACWTLVTDSGNARLRDWTCMLTPFFCLPQ